MFLLHPGQQQHINDFIVFNDLDPGFRRGDDAFFSTLVNPVYLNSAMNDIAVLEALKRALRRLPGVGPKSASRMAYHLLERDREGARTIRSEERRVGKECR